MGVRPYRIAAVLVLAMAVIVATAAPAFAGVVTIQGMTEFNNNFSTPEDTPFDLVLTATDVTPSHLPTMSWYLAFTSLGLTTEPNPSSQTGPTYTLHYNPPANFNSGLFELAQVYAFDTSGNGHWIHINMAVTSVPDAPVVAEGATVAISTNEDTAKSFSLHGSDGDGDALTWWVSSAPVHGDVTTATAGGGATLNLDYTPDVNANGPDPFEVSVSDGAHVTTCLVDMAVASVNDSPAIDQGASMSIDVSEDTPYDFQLTATDIDGQPLAWWTAWEPSGGTLAMEPADSGATLNVTYTPDENFNGPDMFELVVTDGAALDVIDVYVSVSAVNDPPDAASDYPIGNEDSTISGNVIDNDFDVEGDVMYVHTFESAAIPYMGSVLQSLPEGTIEVWWDGRYQFTPAPDVFGTFDYIVWVADGMYVVPSMLSFSVEPVNDAPVIVEGSGLSLTTNEDTQRQFTLTADDVDGDILECRVSSAPLNGSVTVDSLDGLTLDVIYTPAENFNGSDPFEISVSDGLLEDATAIQMTVDAVNDTPVALGDEYWVDEDGTLDVPVPGVMDNDEDVDGDLLTCIGAVYPANGDLFLYEDGSLSYLPDTDYSGPDSFMYYVSDGVADSQPVTVNINVGAINDAPVGVALGNDQIAENAPVGTLVGTVSAVDIDSGPLTYSLVGEGSDDFAISGNELTATRTFDYENEQSLAVTVRVNDGDGGVVDQPFSISIIDVNEPPEVVVAGFTIAEEETLAEDISPNASDPEGAALTWSVVTGPENAAEFALGEAGTLTYIPAPNYVGADSFTYEVTDGVHTVQSTVDIEVSGVNDAPVAADDAYETDEDVALSLDAPGILSNDDDVDGDALTPSLAVTPAHGGLEFGDDGAFVYSPESGWSGTDIFTYVISDGSLVSSAATVTITVTAVDTAFTPVAGTDRIGTSIAVCTAAFPGDATADTVVLATSRNWPDALGGSALAGAVNGPILLTGRDAVSSEVIAEIKRLKAANAYVLGGENAVSSAVMAQLDAELEGDVVRLGGASRYETAAMVASETVSITGGADGTAFLAKGTNFADALAASSLAAYKSWPIYLSAADDLTDVTAGAMTAAGIDQVVILGGEGAIASAVEAELTTLGFGTRRLSGDDRYATGVAVAEYGVEIGLGWDGMALATGQNFPDGLSGGVLAARNGAVMLLNPASTLHSAVRDVVSENRTSITSVYYIGGTSAISMNVRNDIEALLR